MIYARNICYIPQGTPATLIESLHTKSQINTGGLAYCFHLKKGSQVVLTVSIDLTDSLANGKLGTAYNIPYTESQISKIYVEFDDPLVIAEWTLASICPSQHSGITHFVI